MDIEVYPGLVDQNPYAAVAGALGATSDPGYWGNSPALTSGTIYLSRIPLPRPVTITAVKVAVQAAAVTPTTNQNFVGLYDSAGTLLALSQDLSSVTNSTGEKTATLTAQGGASLTRGGGSTAIYVAMLQNAATPAVMFGPASNSTAINIGFSAPFRCASTLSGQTSLPASLAMASVTIGAARFGAILV